MLDLVLDSLWRHVKWELINTALNDLAWFAALPWLHELLVNWIPPCTTSVLQKPSITDRWRSLELKTAYSPKNWKGKLAEGLLQQNRPILQSWYQGGGEEKTCFLSFLVARAYFLLTMVFFSQKKLKTKYLKLATFQNFALRWIMSFLTLTKFEDKYLVKKRKTNLPFLLVLMWQLRFLNLLESRQDWGSLTQGGWWYVHCIRIWGLALKENRHNFHLCLKELYLY